MDRNSLSSMIFRHLVKRHWVIVIVNEIITTFVILVKESREGMSRDNTHLHYTPIDLLCMLLKFCRVNYSMCEIHNM